MQRSRLFRRSAREGFNQPHFCADAHTLPSGFIHSNTRLLHERPYGKRGAGFTLVELLVYITIVSMVMVTISIYFSTVSAHAARTRTVHAVQHEARTLMVRLVGDVRRAAAIDTLHSVLDDDQGQLILNDVSGGTVTYRLDTGRVYYDDGAGSIPLTADTVRVTQLRFSTSTADHELDISIAAAQANPNLRASAQYALKLQSSAVVRTLLY